MKCKEYTLTGEQVMALFSLLFHHNLLELSKGNIVAVGDKLDPADGKLLR